MELDYQVKPTLRQRINWRLLMFCGVIGLFFGWVIYTYASSIVTGGIHHHGNYADVDLKALGQFPFDDQNGQLTDVPKIYRELDGQKIVLRGKMWSGDGSAMVNHFQFVYDVAKCCFGGPPRVQERVFVHLPRGMHPVVLMGPYDLMQCTGTLHVRIKRNPVGTVVSVYDMDLEQIVPVQ